MNPSNLPALVNKISMEWPLRLGLGLMYLYAGFQLFNQPVLWRSFLPVWYAGIIERVISVETYLRMQGIAEIFIGLLFLVPLELVLTGWAWFSGKWGVFAGTLYAIIEFLFILIFTGVDLITFRDIGLLGAAVALLIISLKKGET
ncbi:MAG: hypothetical protein ACK4NX_02745 [Candidatus Paceibacteria bacterium]